MRRRKWCGWGLLFFFAVDVVVDETADTDTLVITVFGVTVGLVGDVVLFSSKFLESHHCCCLWCLVIKALAAAAE